MLPLHDDNPTESTPAVTFALIGSCVLIFLWQVSLGTEAHSRVVYALGSIPAVLFGNRELDPGLVVVPAWATVFTSMFLHGGWMHLIGNMLFLWIFGNNIEDVMGHGRFIVFYLLCGVAAAMAQAVPDPDSVVPMIGASGAISGVLGAYLLLFPHARVLVGIPLGFLIYTVYMPAAFVLVLWFGLQLLNSWLAGDQEGGVAFGAHIGGFVAGMILIPLFKRSDVRFFAPPRPRRR
jgi:membrane associated rhomboid family serine protease